VCTVASDRRTISDRWDASGWARLGSGIRRHASPLAGHGSPATTSPATPDHLDLFIVGTDSRVQAADSDVISGWSSWSPIGDLLVVFIGRAQEKNTLFRTEKRRHPDCQQRRSTFPCRLPRSMALIRHAIWH